MDESRTSFVRSRYSAIISKDFVRNSLNSRLHSLECLFPGMIGATPSDKKSEIKSSEKDNAKERRGESNRRETC